MSVSADVTECAEGHRGGQWKYRKTEYFMAIIAEFIFVAFEHHTQSIL